jgi:hypothetical protein
MCICIELLQCSTCDRLTQPANGRTFLAGKFFYQTIAAGRAACLREGTLAVSVGEGIDARSLETRIERMHQRDRKGAIAFVVGLWVAVLFVLFTMWPLVGDGTIRIVLAVAGIAVLAFNTAAIVAMLRHYRDDKHFIYGLDIKHLDEMRRRKRI